MKKEEKQPVYVAQYEVHFSDEEEAKNRLLFFHYPTLKAAKAACVAFAFHSVKRDETTPKRCRWRNDLHGDFSFADYLGFSFTIWKLEPSPPEPDFDATLHHFIASIRAERKSVDDA